MCPGFLFFTRSKNFRVSCLQLSEKIVSEAEKAFRGEKAGMEI
jgi:hypothetical protein